MSSAPFPPPSPRQRTELKHIQAERVDAAARGYLLLGALVLSLVVALDNRQLLPARYFNDDARLQKFIAYPFLITSQGSFRGTVDLFRLLHLGGHPQIVATVAMVMLTISVLVTLVKAMQHGTVDNTSVTILAAALVFGAIYFAQYSKEFFVLPIVIVFLLRRERRSHELIFFVVAGLYAFEVRSYWFGVLAVFVANRYILKRLPSRRLVAAYLTSLVAAAALVLSTGLGNSVGYERAGVIASLSVDPTTAIHPPLGASVIDNLINTVYVWLTLLLPLPLLRLGAVYIVTGGLIAYLWWQLLARLPLQSIPTGMKLNYDALCLLLAYVSVEALFEPDYGSYLRHLSPFLVLFVLVRQLPRWRTTKTNAAAVTEPAPRAQAHLPRTSWAARSG
jgi:hypothetical protein